MCGITGYWGPGEVAPEASLVGAMSQRLSRSGPDGSGTWLDSEAGLALAHRRLSIMDLSEAGHQPMVSPCGRYVIVYNGEIYNHTDLRAELEAEGRHFAWRGHSDTETLLAALRHWGVEETLQRLNGMFAFALWDGAQRTLVLARDRMGEKPLYYGRQADTFLFGSELKALVVHPDWQGQVDRDALALYLRYSYVPTPWSIYQGIRKLPPAHYVVIGDNGRGVGEPQCYWDLASIAEQGVASAGGEPGELTQSLDELLGDAVSRRMVADVPLGAFLSGGYDSTMVAALMQAQSDRPVKTFSIGFHEEGYNEAEHAKAVAQHLGTDHTEWYISPEEAMAVVPDLPEMYDEPFADVSQIPTHLVSRLARQHVTVSLSGDGGDELFAGYNRHVVGPSVWNKVAWMPRSLRRVCGWGVGMAAGASHQSWARWLGLSQTPQLEQKLGKLASALRAGDGDGFYEDLVSVWKEPGLVKGASGRESGDGNSSQRLAPLNRPEAGSYKGGVTVGDNGLSLRERMLLLDMLTYLPDDGLTKVDRATRAVALEARVPLLDHRVVEFAWRVPEAFKYRDGQGKWLLRQVLYRYVPKALMDRPKMGFSVPIDEWLRGPLRDWAEELLDADRLEREGYFHPEPIRQVWQGHLSGQRDHGQRLWTVLMFQAWFSKSADSRAPTLDRTGCIS